MKLNLFNVVHGKDGNVGRELNKKVAIPLGLLGVLVIGLIAFFVFKSSQVNYWDTMHNIFSSELGTFRYVFDVRTAPKGELITVKTDETVSLDQLHDIDMVGDSTESTENEQDEDKNKNEFSDWNDSAVVRTQEWEYPNYQIIVDGCTTSLEPLTSQFTISIATEYYNSKFTEIIAFEGKYYVDIESMRNWYANSGDVYLITLAEDIPEGIKYLVIPEEEFGFISGYAELSELENSKTYGLDIMYRKFLVFLDAINTIVVDTLGNKGVTPTSDSSTLDLGTAECWELVSTIKPYLSQGDVFYTGLVNEGNNRGLYTEEQYNQALKERDNVLEGLSDMNTYLSVVSSSKLKTKIEGFCREYVNGSGNDCLEGKLKLGIVTEDTDYLVQVDALRSGNAKDIKVPQGSQMKYSELADKNLLQDRLFIMLDYFNFTYIDFEKQLDDTVDSISTDLMYKFIDIINERGCYPHHVRMSNVQKFIDKYANYEETSETTENDLECYKLLSDFYTELNNLTGGVVQYQDVIIEEEIARFPVMDATLNNVSIKTVYNEELSSANLLVLDVELLNKSEEVATFDCSNFICQNLLNSIIPANNDTLLKSYDNAFDVSSLDRSVELQPKSWDTVRLYFVLNTAEGHVDLLYNDVKLGAVIEY